jgi:hypothetical protein
MMMCLGLAILAVANSVLPMALLFMLREGIEFHDLGAHYFA